MIIVGHESLFSWTHPRQAPPRFVGKVIAEDARDAYRCHPQNKYAAVRLHCMNMRRK